MFHLKRVSVAGLSISAARRTQLAEFLLLASIAVAGGIGFFLKLEDVLKAAAV